MEPINISWNGGQLEILGIPNADKAIKLPSSMAKYLVDLSLHETDLRISKESLSFMEGNQLTLDSIILESLWRSAIIHFTKCFTDQMTIHRNGRKVAPDYSRIKLDKKRIFLNKLAIDSFDFIMTLRNKHVVHDENPYLQSSPGFIINDGTHVNKVEKVFCTLVKNETIEGNFNNLSLLVKDALDYVKNEFTQECVRITTELEEIPFNKLLEFGEVRFDIASLEAMTLTRKLD